jgi:serine/threonine-protein kinase
VRELRTGVTIAGKFRLTGPIAKGGMGAVWAAWNSQLDVPVAIKFMTAEALSSAELVARFEREAKAAAQLRSPQVVQIFETGVVDGVPFMVMELLEGEDLSRRLKSRGRLPIDEAARIVGEVCKALRRAHEMGIIHRDLKPANVFLSRNGDDEVVKVLDFGIAKLLATNAGEATKTGALIGTPHYMSPEQARRTHRRVDHRSDLWALGVIAFRALTGSLPFPGDDPIDVLVRVCTTDAPAPSSIAKDLGPAVDAFFARALASDPDQRFQSAREFAEAMNALAGRGAADPATLGASWHVAPSPRASMPSFVGAGAAAVEIPQPRASSPAFLGAAAAPEIPQPRASSPAFLGAAAAAEIPQPRASSPAFLGAAAAAEIPQPRASSPAFLGAAAAPQAAPAGEPKVVVPATTYAAELPTLATHVVADEDSIDGAQTVPIQGSPAAKAALLRAAAQAAARAAAKANDPGAAQAEGAPGPHAFKTTVPLGTGAAPAPYWPASARPPQGRASAPPDRGPITQAPPSSHGAIAQPPPSSHGAIAHPAAANSRPAGHPMAATPAPRAPALPSPNHGAALQGPASGLPQPGASSWPPRSIPPPGAAASPSESPATLTSATGELTVPLPRRPSVVVWIAAASALLVLAIIGGVLSARGGASSDATSTLSQPSAQAPSSTANPAPSPSSSAPGPSATASAADPASPAASSSAAATASATAAPSASAKPSAAPEEPSLGGASASATARTKDTSGSASSSKTSAGTRATSVPTSAIYAPPVFGKSKP